MIVIGALGAAYFWWACYRTSQSVLYHSSTPQPFPSPDVWLWPLHDWYHRMFPVAPGFIKLHGEIGKLRTTVESALFLCLFIFGSGILSLLRRGPIYHDGRCNSCGYDLRGNPDSAVCPECGEPQRSITPPTTPLQRMGSLWLAPASVGWSNIFSTALKTMACLLAGYVGLLMAFQFHRSGGEWLWSCYSAARWILILPAYPVRPLFIFTDLAAIALLIAAARMKRARTVLWCVLLFAGLGFVVGGLVR